MNLVPSHCTFRVCELPMCFRLILAVTDSYCDFLMLCKIYTQDEVEVPVTSWAPKGEWKRGERGKEKGGQEGRMGREGEGEWKERREREGKERGREKREGRRNEGKPITTTPIL